MEAVNGPPSLALMRKFGNKGSSLKALEQGGVILLRHLSYLPRSAPSLPRRDPHSHTPGSSCPGASLSFHSWPRLAPSRPTHIHSSSCPISSIPYPVLPRSVPHTPSSPCPVCFLPFHSVPRLAPFPTHPARTRFIIPYLFPSLLYSILSSVIFVPSLLISAHYLSSCLNIVRPLLFLPFPLLLFPSSSVLSLPFPCLLPFQPFLSRPTPFPVIPFPAVLI